MKGGVCCDVGVESTVVKIEMIAKGEGVGDGVVGKVVGCAVASWCCFVE